MAKQPGARRIDVTSDFCFQIMRRVGKAERPVGDVISILEIGDGQGQMPATLDGNNNYIPKHDVTHVGTKPFFYIFVRNIPASSIKQVIHWSHPLEDGDEIKDRHCTVVVIAELPAPRRAEMNTNNHTTMNWDAFSGQNPTTGKDRYMMKLITGGRRAVTESDIKTVS